MAITGAAALQAPSRSPRMETALAPRHGRRYPRAVPGPRAVLWPHTIFCCSLEVLYHGVIVDPAQHLLLHQAELLARGELPLAGEAGEAGQVVGIAARSPHPITGVDLPAAAGALGTKTAAGGEDTA